MTETVAGAVAKRDNGPTALIEQYREDFAMVLPSHIKPATWVRVALGVCRQNKQLAQVAQSNPASFLASLLDCARLGHEPGTDAYYLVPFGNEVVGIEGYQGEIERMYRAGAVASVVAQVVHQNDEFTYVPGRDERPIHVIDWDAGDRGPLRLVYAYAAMKDGATSRVVVMNAKQVEAHKRESKGHDKATSPWQKWTEAMWLKTAVHQLEKWVPTSNEYREQMLRSLAASQEVELPAVAPTTPAPADLPGGDGVHEPLEGELLTDDGRPVDDPWASGVSAS